ncbi:probable RNA helicase armi isoform X2 [Schistocerca nitens]|uniref:probable RNA helicase armi isoform X2 n=1 Tax=Schistocerca nitens TaxID=7011 RepID=UPI0021194352|nr:probable RNA helicase armi isoform X2 [Schistocerca nitens]
MVALKSGIQSYSYIFECEASFYVDMISIVAKLSRYLLGSTDSELETSEKDFSVVDLLSSLEQNAASNESCAPSEIEGSVVQDLSKDSCCCYRVGVVTHVHSDYALIDDEVYCDLNDPAYRNIKVGNKLEYLAFRLRPSDEWRVKKIYSIQEENWENSEPLIEKRETLSRSIVGQVMSRDGRNVIISDKLKFSLDDVSCDFIPVEGDWILIDALVELDGSIANLEGEILHLFSVRALRSRIVTGRITNYESTGDGLVDKSIYFSKEVCEPGYVPELRDEVIVEAIESTRQSVLWRALSVVPLHTSNTGQHNYSKSKVEQKKPVLESISVNGVTVTPAVLQSGELKIGEEKEISVTLLNTGQTKQVVKFCQFLSQMSWSQLRLKSPSIDKLIVLHPGKSFSYYFICHGRYAGCHTEKFRFVFKGFKIEIAVEVRVRDDSQSNNVRNSQSGKMKFDTLDAIKRENDVSGRLLITGVKPRKAPPFVPVRIGQYVVPKYLWQFVYTVESQRKSGIEQSESLTSVVPYLSDILSFINYSDFFHTLLHLEEISETIKMRQYDLTNVTFRITGPGAEFLALEVPGLAEKRPSLLVGDKAIAGLSSNKGMEYEGFVHEVYQREVWLKFNKNFHLAYNGEEYDVTFRISRSGYMRCHAAVDLAVKNLGSDMLFPTTVTLKSPQLHIDDDDDDDDDDDEGQHQKRTSSTSSTKDKIDFARRKIQWFNRNLNIYQKKAIKCILKGEARPLPYVIFGPPGTGKTVTLVEVILQIFHLIPDSRLVVATPSNSSANLVAQRLLESGLLQPGDMVRLVGYRYLEEGGMPEDLIPYCLCAEVEQSHLMGRHRITVGTCVALGQLFIAGLPRGHFTHVLVDEAGQALEPELLIPVAGCLDKKLGQVVLAGDPQQLGPIVSSAAAKEYGLGESYLSRLLHCPPYLRDTAGFPGTGYNPRLVTKLLYNYRSLPEILEVPNKMFYNSELIAQISEKESNEAKLLASVESILPSRSSPPAVVFHGVIGTNYQDAECPSWYNPEEIVIVTSYIQKLYKLGLTADQIGVITPYQRQVKRLRDVLKQLETSIPKIGSVEEFQGQERMVTILSAVRSNAYHIKDDIRRALGFVSSPQRLNVAITRARALLVVVGNPVLLARDPFWRILVSFCISRNCYIGCDLPVSIQNMCDNQLDNT